MRTRHRQPITRRRTAGPQPLDAFQAESVRDHISDLEERYFPAGVSVGDPSTPPAAPTGVEVASGIRSLIIQWDRIDGLQSVDGAGGYEVQVAEDSAFTTNARAQRTGGTLAAWTDLTAGTTYYVRVRGIQGVDNLGEWSTPITGTPDGVTGPDLPPDSSFIRNVETLPTLPDADYPPDETVVFNQADGKLYRNVGDEWTASVATVDLEGQITMSQIADGAVGDSQIADFVVSARKFNTTDHTLY